MNDGDVGVEGGNGGERLPGIGTAHGADLRVGQGQIGSHVVSQGPERQPRRAGAQAGHHAEVGIFLQLQCGLLAFDRSPKGMERAGTGIPRPGEHQLSGAAGGDHLVVYEVRRESAECEVAPALPDDFVAGRETDEVGEAFDHDDIAIVHVGGDRIAQADDFGPNAQAISLRQLSIIPSATSISCSSITRGGASRSALFPAPSSSSPRRNARWTSSWTSSGAPSRVVRSLTNSIPTMRPRPRTSPMTGCLAISRQAPARSRSPIRAALAINTFSTRSSVASAAAQQTGLPPKVEPWDPLSQVVIDSFAIMAPIGMPDPSPLAVNRMSGSIPSCSQANILPVRPTPD